MSILEIAKIQIRRGQENQTGVPKLAGGEFGWAVDTENLYIGLTREDGGSRDENVRILTEKDLKNFFSSVAAIENTSSYTYRVGTYITDIDGNGFNDQEYVRSVQSKLDGLELSVADFGIVGNGTDNLTASLQTIIDNLYFNAKNLSGDPVQTLKFPAGIYLISDTLKIPKNTHIVGDGIDRTIIRLTGSAAHLFKTIDLDRNEFEANGMLSSINEPDNVKIENLTLEHDSAVAANLMLSMVSLDCADNALIKNVKFKGNYSIGSIPGNNNAGIDIRGYQTLTSENVLVERCHFENLAYGIKSNYDIVNPIISNCTFDALYRAISFNDPKDSSALMGPRYARITGNRFENVETQAVYEGGNSSNTGTYIVSINNQFINVGNNCHPLKEYSSTGTSIITFNSKNNSSVNDYFRRYEVQQSNPSGTNVYHPLISGRGTIDNNYASTVILNGGPNVIIRLPLTQEAQNLEIKYSINNETVDRIGTINVYIAKGGIPIPQITDNFNFYNSEGGLIVACSVNDFYKYFEVTIDNPGELLEMTYQTKLMV